MFAGEDVERLVRIEGVDDVVAVREDALVLVAVESYRIGEAGHIEPPDGHAFTEARGVQQSVYLLLVSIGGSIGDEGSGLIWRGRQAGQVKGGATEQPFLGSFGGRLDLLRGQFGTDESVDRILASGWQGRHDGGFERFVGPVWFVDGALGDPPTEEFLLGGREGLVRLLVRHHIVFVLGEETFDDFALVGFTRHNRDGAAFPGLQGVFTDI